MPEFVKYKKLGFMFPINVNIYKETADGLKRDTDKARVIRTKSKGYLELWRYHVKLPIPKPELVSRIRGKKTIDVIINRKGEFKYCKLFSGNIEKENQIKQAMNEIVDKINELDIRIERVELKEHRDKLKKEKEDLIEKLNMLDNELKYMEMYVGEIPQDIRHWQILQARADRETYSEETFFKKYGGFITIMVTAIGSVMLLFVTLKYGFMPLIQQGISVAKQLTTIKVQVVGEAITSGTAVPPA